MNATQDTRTIRVVSPLGADVLLFYRMSGNDGLSELGEYQVEMLSERSDIAIDDVLGQQLSVKIDIDARRQREFNGIVTRFALAGKVGRYSRYLATVRPWLWLLTRSSDCRIFQDKNAFEVIKTIFGKCHVADFDLAQSTSLASMPYCVQYRETDFDFVSRLMERFGLYFYFRHEGGRHILVLTDSAVAHDPIVGVSTLPFDSEAPGRRVDTVYSWQASGEIVTDQHILQAYDFAAPSVDLTAMSTVDYDYAGQARGLERYDYSGLHMSRAAGEAEAKVRVQASGAEQRRIEGRATAAAVASGGLFTLSQHPARHQNQEVLVVRARYALFSDRFESEPGMPKRSSDDTPQAFDCAFDAIPRNAIFRAARRTPAPVVHGPQTAVVVGKSGEEIWTDKYGRVRVRFHWERDTSGGETSSCWIRVAQSWAGKGFGQLVTPRIGQEVVVSFLEGDPDRPLITGAVYNGTNMPPVELPANPTRSTFKTNTSKGGLGFNELRFEDKKGSEEIFVQAERDYNRIVKNNDTLKVGFEKAEQGDQTVEIKNDQTLTIGHDQTVGIDGKQDVKVGTTIVIEAGTSIELKVGASSIKIEAGKITMKAPEIEIAADANAKVKAGAMMDIKSGAVMTIGGALVQIN